VGGKISGGGASERLRNSRSISSLVYRGIAKAVRGFAKIAPLLAIGVAVGVAFGAPTTKSKPAKISTPTVSCPSGNLFTFQNNNTYPVWLGEAYQGGGDFSSNIITPPNNDWMMPAGTSVSLCMPSGWSGNFWARTGCDFVTPFNNDPDYQSCTATSQCAAGHVCYGGECLLDCTSGSTGDTPFCQGQTGLDNPNAICLLDQPNAQGTPRVQVCTYPQLCQTGDCAGLYQCYGDWNGLDTKHTGAAPVSLFELTSNSATSVNYDVSLVSGYNTAISVVPSSNSCYAPGCVTDLNQVCPANLQVTASPTASPGPTPIPCGSGYCETGFCNGNSTCVVGCNQPGLQCASSPAPAGLNCTSVIPSPTASPFWSPDGSEYRDMYSAKNLSNAVTTQGNGISMASANQGTATCWADIDCKPGQTCAMGLVPAFPDGVGLCLPEGSPPINCASQSDVGNACGGYEGDGFPNALGYTCVSIIPSPFPSGSPTPSPGVACVPAVEAGLGSLETPTATASPAPLFSGLGGLTNPEWQAAAMQAGNGTIPYYETFSNACPHEYAWQYDDNSGGLNCDTGTGGANVNMTISFSAAASPTPTPTPSPAGSMTVLPKLIGFGIHKIGTQTKPRIVTVINPLKNKQPMSISGFSTTTTQFTIDSGKATTCTTSTTLGRGKRCKIGVIFSPDATGMQTDALTIQSNASNQPRTVTLRGRGK
jgi:hypothetical protein